MSDKIKRKKFRPPVETGTDKRAREREREREDKSGDRAEAMLKEAGYEVVHRTIVPDEKTELVQKMKEFFYGEADG